MSSPRPDTTNDRVALVFRGDRSVRASARIENSRLGPVAAALADVGLTAEPAVFSEEMAEEVRTQLLGARAVLVWVDPVTGSADRAVLDDLLRDVAAAGVWVSAHPDVIVKMGTKEVLHRTRELGWGSDVELYRSPAEFGARFPAKLETGARVLKQYRGNGGIGVWKVKRTADRTHENVLVQSARAGDDSVEETSLSGFMARCGKYFTYTGGEGRLIDQPFQPRIIEGITRCYLVKDKVAGFCRQYPAGRSPADLTAGVDTTTIPANRVFGLPSAKTMYPPDEPAFRSLRHHMEREWVPAMQQLVDVDTPSLPALWDADFLFGTTHDDGTDSYVLSEINVSAVAPFPPEAVPRLADAVRQALRDATRS